MGVRCDGARQVLMKLKPRNAKALEEAVKLEEVKGDIDALKAAAIETMETAKRRDGLEFVKTEIKLSS
jgi:electron transfer flavoprotein alpha/beta subunit